jgi:cytochrome b561
LMLGLVTESLRGDSFFGLFKLPSYGDFSPEARHAVADQFAGYHNLAATVLLCLAGLHAGAALIHHFLLKDGVLRRMAPR